MALIVRLDDDALQDLNWLITEGGFGDENEAISAAVKFFRSRIETRNSHQSESVIPTAPSNTERKTKELAEKNARLITPEYLKKFLSRPIPNF